MNTNQSGQSVTRTYFIPKGSEDFFAEMDKAIKSLAKGEKADKWDLYYGPQLMAENLPYWACAGRKKQLMDSKVCTVESRFEFKPRKK